MKYLAIIFMVSCSFMLRGQEQENSRPTVAGKPFLMLGTQLRTDFFLQLENKTPEELEPYFELASRLNITVLQVPVSWRDVEPEKGVYSGRLPETYIRYCEKYGMKLELLWFGSYMCGFSVEGYIPDYVRKDTVSFPRLRHHFNGWLGEHFFLAPDSPQLVERESRALEALMATVKNYNRIHGGNTVTGIQVQNEPDMLATRHNALHGLSPDELWPALIRMLDKLGRVVKASGYPAYTRVNLTTTYPDYIEKSKAIVATEGIDFVGLDPYENRVDSITRKLDALAAIPGNYAHIAENGGEYENTDILALKTLSMGYGYSVFEVVTTSHPFLKEWTHRGVYNPDFSPKPHTRRTTDAFGIIRKAWYPFATAAPQNIVVFNADRDEVQEVASARKNTRSATVSWQTGTGGVAFALELDDGLMVASTRADSMRFPGLAITKVEKGFYDPEGQWVAEGIETVGRELNLAPGTVYRIYFTGK